MYFVFMHENTIMKSAEIVLRRDEGEQWRGNLN
jgi:hypothetical protein